MRIALLQDQWWPEVGGGAVHVRELARALATNHGDTVDIITRSVVAGSERFTQTETLCNSRVTVYRVRPCTAFWNPVGRGGAMVMMLVHLLRNEYDVVHAHSRATAVPMRVAAFYQEAPTVFTLHGTTLTTGHGRKTGVKERVRRGVERMASLKFEYDHVISVSEAHVDILTDSHDSVTYIPNGVDIDRFHSFEPASLSDGDTVLFIGRLAAVKRVADLLKAVVNLPEHVTLVVVGDGPRLEKLESLAKSLGVTDRIRFVGQIPYERIPSYFAAADLFVLPSLREGQPMTVLEAWAAGVPVIATDVEGINDIVEHDRTGYLVSPRNPEALADAITHALATDDSSEWAATARDIAEQNYSWESVTDRTRAIYDDIR